VVFGGESALGESTGKAVIDGIVIRIYSEPFFDTCGSVNASLEAALASGSVPTGGLSAKYFLHKGLVLVSNVERTYGV